MQVEGTVVGIDGGILRHVGVIDHAVLAVGNECVNFHVIVGGEPLVTPFSFSTPRTLSQIAQLLGTSSLRSSTGHKTPHPWNTGIKTKYIDNLSLFFLSDQQYRGTDTSTCTNQSNQHHPPPGKALFFCILVSIRFFSYGF